MSSLTADTAGFIDSYIRWIKDNSRETRINGFTEVTTPFVDANNDYLQFYVKRQDQQYFITDDGETIENLILSGCDLKSGKRYELLNQLAASIGVCMKGDEITISGDELRLPQMQHSMIQAMLKISDMFMISSSRVQGMFFGDVEDFFLANDIRYTPSIMLMGKSGLTHRYDFAIPSTKLKPERLINAMNAPSKQGVQAALFAWNDVYSSRPKSKPYMVLNDSKTKIGQEILTAISNNGVVAIPWSKRNDYISELVS